MDELVRDWRCGPLIAHDELADVRVRTPVCDGPPGARGRVDGAGGVLCFTSYNFWGEAGNAGTQVRLPSLPMRVVPAPLREVQLRRRCGLVRETALCGTTSAFAARLLVSLHGTLELHGSSRQVHVSARALIVTGEAVQRPRARAQEAARAAFERFGVGACGPRAFYGSMDAHLAFEAQLAAFMGAEEAIMYSYDVATMTSVLPAFASRKDVIVLDDAAAWPLRNGAQLSRATGARRRTCTLASRLNVLSVRWMMCMHRSALVCALVHSARRRVAQLVAGPSALQTWASDAAAVQ
jgi:Aminotransferase class I and II